MDTFARGREEFIGDSSDLEPNITVGRKEACAAGFIRCNGPRTTKTVKATCVRCCRFALCLRSMRRY